MAKDAVLSFRIPGDLKASLEREAAADVRSVSSLVERILRAWLDGRGHAKQTTPALDHPRDADLERITTTRKRTARDRTRAEPRRTDKAERTKPT